MSRSPLQQCNMVSTSTPNTNSSICTKQPTPANHQIKTTNQQQQSISVHHQIQPASSYWAPPLPPVPVSEPPPNQPPTRVPHVSLSRQPWALLAPRDASWCWRIRGWLWQDATLCVKGVKSNIQIPVGQPREEGSIPVKGINNNVQRY